MIKKEDIIKVNGRDARVIGFALAGGKSVYVKFLDTGHHAWIRKGN